MKYTILCSFFLIFVHSFAQNKNQSVGFKENKGQIIDQKEKPNPDVKFLLNTNGLNVQIKSNGFSYDIYETKKHPLTEKQKAKLRPSLHLENEKEKLPDYSLEYIYHRIDIDFVNFNPKVELIKEEESKDYDNYYNVPNKPAGVLMVHQYKQITYKNIYPNIDVVFSLPKDSLKAVEYNFVVHPKGKISDIQLKFNGAKTELVDNKIRIQVRFGEMDETLPMSWTENGNDNKEIAVGYTKIRNNVYGFVSTENVSNKTVIIDPVPVRLWGTYYGGEDSEFSSSVFVKNGFVYLAGTTYSSSNIASSGAFQNSNSNGAPFQGPCDSFFTKLNSDGTRVWATYYGGEYADKINQIKVSDNENVYIAGSSLSSTNISSLGSHQSQKGLYWDGFLAKFDSNGLREWATYYGGDDNEEANSLSVDSNEKIYICGETLSDKNIASIGSYQPNYNNQGQFPYDGFIAKFNSNGTREWGTYYGGSNRDAILDSKIDSSGNLIFMGITNSALGISTSNSYQEINNNTDGFLVKFDSNGNRIWGSYFGGNNDDIFFNLGIDSSDNLYCFGQTTSTLNISTNGVFQETYIKSSISDNSGCIFKLNPNGFKIWGSYFPSGSYGGSVSKKGDIYFTGTVENSFAATPNAFQEIRNLGNETYLVKFNTQGQREWATYFGGNGADYTNVTAVDDDFNIYLAGSTNSLTNIATPNTYQPNFYFVPFTDNNHLNGYDAFLVKFKDCLSSTTATSNSQICFGKTLELKASGGTDYAWTGPNGFTSSLQNPIIPNATAINSGQYSCAITGTGDCDDTKTVDVIVGDTVAPIPDISTLSTITGDCNTIITTIPKATDICTGIITAITNSPLSYSLAGTYTIVWNYDDGNGNSTTQNQTVIINSQPLPTTTSPQTFCIQQNATLSSIAITGQNINWYDALTNGNLLANTTLLQNAKTYYASQTINGCESERIPVLINIQNTAIPSATSPQTFCASQNPTLNTIVITGTTLKWYNSSTDLNVLPISTALQNGQTYYATQTLNGCESPTRLAITIVLISTLPSNNYEELFCDDLNDGSETVNLSSYNSSIMSNTTNYNFTYYNSISGAQNEIAANKIPNFTNYKLALGENKIYVRINSNTPCYAVAEIKLTLLSKPIINIQDIVPICENKTITIDAGAGFDSYLWSNGAKTQTILVANPGNFSVTVTNDYDTISCSSTKKFEVKKSNKATINTIETKDWTDSDNVITVFATGNGDYEYSIDGVNYQTSSQFTGLISGKYTVLVRDKNGCGTATDEVYLLMFPRYFTPNGDGYNETWKIKFSDMETGLTVKIYDRYGKIIKVLNTNSDSWNGTYNGTDLPATDYWFIVTRANGVEYKGHFSLKR